MHLAEHMFLFVSMGQQAAPFRVRWWENSPVPDNKGKYSLIYSCEQIWPPDPWTNWTFFPGPLVPCFCLFRHHSIGNGTAKCKFAVLEEGKSSHQIKTEKQKMVCFPLGTNSQTLCKPFVKITSVVESQFPRKQRSCVFTRWPIEQPPKQFQWQHWVVPVAATIDSPQPWNIVHEDNF